MSSNYFDSTKNPKSNDSMDVIKHTPNHNDWGCYNLEDTMATFKDNLLVNRIIALLIGGLLVFAIMSLTVIKTGKKENTELSLALDESRYEAGRLLADAKAQLENKDYIASKATLEKLFINQPGSPEAVEGKALFTSINTAEAVAKARWEAALPQVKEDWSQAMAAELRAQSAKEVAEMEADLDKTIEKAWDKAKAEVRTTWEAQENITPVIS